MTPKFIGEQIEVETISVVKQPARLTWQGRDYLVAEVTHTWADWGFAAGASQRDWRTRRHRNYFRLRTESGEIFEIYHDRSRSVEGTWYLYQQLEP